MKISREALQQSNMSRVTFKKCIETIAEICRENGDHTKSPPPPHEDPPIIVDSVESDVHSKVMLR